MKSKHLFKEAFKAGYKKALKENTNADSDFIKTKMFDNLLYVLAENLGHTTPQDNPQKNLESIINRLSEDLQLTIQRAFDEAMSYTLEDIAEKFYGADGLGGDDELEEKCYDLFSSAFTESDNDKLEVDVFNQIVKNLRPEWFLESIKLILSQNMIKFLEKIPEIDYLPKPYNLIIDENGKIKRILIKEIKEDNTEHKIIFKINVEIKNNRKRIFYLW